MKWIQRNLGDLTKIRTGKLDANASSEDGEYPFFTCAQEPLRIGSYSYDCECALVAGNGDLNVKYYKGKFDAYQRTYIVEARPEAQNLLHIRYMYHFLETYLETLRKQSIGGIIKYIKLGNLTEAQIPLPPLAEQKRIAGILDAADALRAIRRETLAQLDTLLQATFLDMFGDPITNPKGWEFKSLSGCCDVLTGFAFPSGRFIEAGSGIALCRGVNIALGEINWNDRVDWPVPYDEKLARFKIQEGDILLAMDRPWIAGGLKIAVATSSDLPSLLVQRVARIRAENAAMQSLVYTLICSSCFKHHCKPTETTVPHISPRELKSFPVIAPPLDLQRRYAAIVGSVEQQKARMRTHLAELDALFASLQSRAFNGEL